MRFGFICKNTIFFLCLLGVLYLLPEERAEVLSSDNLITSEQVIEDKGIFSWLSNLPLTEKLACSLPEFYRTTRSVIHKVRQGETLSTIWKANGADSAAANYAAEAMLKAGIDKTEIKSGEELELQLLGDDVIALKRRLDGGKVLVLEKNEVAGYDHELITPKIVLKERTVSGTITSSFFQAAASQEVPFSVIDELVDLFSSRVEFSKSMQEGDTFSVVYTEKCLENGEVIEPGPIKAASIENAGKFMAVVRHVAKDGVERFYNEEGETLGNYFLRYPLNFTRISSSFSHARFHPVLKVKRPHNGVDFSAPTGTPVRTVADGIVEYAGYNGGAGNMVKIKHGDRYTTAYLHLSKIDVKKGARVVRGTVIGKVGQTGWATGPHLHFSFYDRGKYIDPLSIDLPSISDGTAPIPVKYLNEMIKDLKIQHHDVKIARNFPYKNIG